MKKNILSLTLALLAGFSIVAQTTYNVDKKAQLVWHAEKVTGAHDGTVNVSKGNFTIADGTLTAGTFEVDMQSILCTDLTGEYKAQLEGHLKSDDFFSVANHPTATLVITSASKQGDNIKVRGNLTIKGKTNPVEFTVQVTENGNKATVSGKLTVNRAKYDVKFGSGSFFDGLGDKLIYDEFDLNFNFTATK